MKRARLLCVLLLLGSWLPAWAAPSVSYRAMDGANWTQIAARHGVTLKALRKANAEREATAEWLLLPPGARRIASVDVALMASAYQEIGAIVKAAQIEGVYRIVGREFHVGTWQGSRIIAGALPWFSSLCTVVTLVTVLLCMLTLSRLRDGYALRYPSVHTE